MTDNLGDDAVLLVATPGTDEANEGGKANIAHSPGNEDRQEQTIGGQEALESVLLADSSSLRNEILDFREAASKHLLTTPCSSNDDEPIGLNTKRPRKLPAGMHSGGGEWSPAKLIDAKTASSGLPSGAHPTVIDHHENVEYLPTSGPTVAVLPVALSTSEDLGHSEGIPTLLHESSEPDEQISPSTTTGNTHLHAGSADEGKSRTFVSPGLSSTTPTFPVPHCQVPPVATAYPSQSYPPAFFSSPFGYPAVPMYLTGGGSYVPFVAPQLAVPASTNKTVQAAGKCSLPQGLDGSTNVPPQNQANISPLGPSIELEHRPDNALPETITAGSSTGQVEVVRLADVHDGGGALLKTLAGTGNHPIAQVPHVPFYSQAAYSTFPPHSHAMITPHASFPIQMIPSVLHQQHQQQQRKDPPGNSLVRTAPDSLRVSGGISISLACDRDQLSDYQVLVRQQLELFEAGLEDVESNTQGRKKPVVLGQVGLRCRNCSHFPLRARGRGAVYYPNKLQGVYQAAQNMAASHLTQSCQEIPSQIREEIQTLKCRRDNASGGKQYWADGCRALGIKETEHGLAFARISSTILNADAALEEQTTTTRP